MNEESEKFSNKLLVLFTTIIFLFVSFICFIFIGVANVDAQSIPTIVESYPSGLLCGVNQPICENPNVTYTQIITTSTTDGLNLELGQEYLIDFETVIRVTTWLADPSTSFGIQVTTTGNNTSITTCDSDCSFTISQPFEVSGMPGYYYRFKWKGKVNITGESKRQISFAIYSSSILFGSAERILTIVNTTDPNISIIENANKNTQDIINNQNQNTQQIVGKQEETNEKLDELNDSLLNSNTSSSSNSLNSFFGNFNNSDNGGLSAIITAPLTAINKVLDNSCPSLDGSYKGQSFSIPSGCVFWNRIPQVKDMANLISGGFLCYLILRKMFLLIHQLKDPNDDRVEVLNL